MHFKTLSRIQDIRADNERYGLSLVFLCIPMAASIPVLGSIGSRMVAPVLYSALIALCGALFLGSFTWREIRENWNSGIRRQRLKLFCVGLFGTALANLFLFLGLSLTTGSNASILLQVEPVYAVLITTLFLGERPTHTQLFATALIITGAVIVLCPGTFRICTGDLLVLAVPLFFVIANILARSCMEHGLSPHVVVTFRVFWGGILLSLFGLFTDSWHDVPWASPLFVTSVVTVGLFGMVLNGTFWYMAISKAPLSSCTTLISTYPILAVACSWIFLKETPRLTQVAGLCLVLAGIFTMCKKGKNNVETLKTNRSSFHPDL